MVLVIVVGLAFTYTLGYGPVGVVIAVIIGAGSAFFGYWQSDKIALGLSGAKPASPEQYPRLHNIVDGLCIASGIPEPRLYVIDDPAPNAFATGRNPNHAAVAVTTGLMDKMNRMELEAVLAHELAHVQNYDILVSTLAVTMVGIVAVLADLGVRMLWFGGGRGRRGNSNASGPAAILAILGVALLVLSPIIARAMQSAVSRRRELLADTSGVAMTRYPPALISALEKLQDDTTVVRSQSRATAHLWIESPLDRNATEHRLGKLNRMFDTHPPLEERIEALREL